MAATMTTANGKFPSTQRPTRAPVLSPEIVDAWASNMETP